MPEGAGGGGGVEGSLVAIAVVSVRGGRVVLSTCSGLAAVCADPHIAGWLPQSGGDARGKRKPTDDRDARRRRLPKHREHAVPKMRVRRAHRDRKRGREVEAVPRSHGGRRRRPCRGRGQQYGGEHCIALPLPLRCLGEGGICGCVNCALLRPRARGRGQQHGRPSGCPRSDAVLGKAAAPPPLLPSRLLARRQSAAADAFPAW